MSTTTTATEVPDWRRTIERIERRNGAIDLRVNTTPDARDRKDASAITSGAGRGLLRVRLLQLGSEEMVVELPKGEHASAMPGASLTGYFVEGENRWSFQSRVLERVKFSLNERTQVPALRLNPPCDVKAVQRRDYFRVHAEASVELWSLRDPVSCVDAEQANQLLHKQGEDGGRRKGAKGKTQGSSPPFPRLSGKLQATLANVSGGGMGVHASVESESLLSANPLFWVRLTLAETPHPLLAAARAMHWRRETQSRLYVGMAFVFDHNPRHEEFVTQVLCRFIAAEQRRQLRMRR